ncbi:MAG TPA: hypothetical protein VNJ50_04185 [Gelidibacter sp.]|uniref:hypothetical protein n=1 Tax=Gelidibacter sp. TaxID=2018083 RepID=UPI002CA45014|nr:hypothetical protein [Gelidibacter sp.]HXJ98021.1 hypothetical protein [Gelidibacter sp.]
MKATIKNLIDNTDTKLGRFISMFIQVLILISVVTFSMETIPDLSSQTRICFAKLKLFASSFLPLSTSLGFMLRSEDLNFFSAFMG